LYHTRAYPQPGNIASEHEVSPTREGSSRSPALHDPGLVQDAVDQLEQLIQNQLADMTRAKTPAAT
jgi:hypothetical protein